MDYISLFQKAAAQYADRVALYDGFAEHPLTYAALDALSGCVAGKLRALGVRKGQFAAVCMGRRVEYIAAYLGILKAGCAVVPIIPDYPEQRRRFMAENCNAALTITEDFFADVQSYAPVCDPAQDKEPGLLIYTSGSTGTPKGILYSAADIARAALRQHVVFEDIAPVRFAAMGMFTFGVHLTEYPAVFLRGGTSFIVPAEARQSIGALEDFYRRFEITIGYIPPQMLRLAKGNTPTLRRVITGSERVVNLYSPEYDIICIYGMSETGLISIFHIDRPYENTPLGAPYDDISLPVCDEDGNPVPDGTEGEIHICGPFDCQYFRDPERTARVMRPHPDGTVHIRTGDVGYYGKDGNLYYVNRKDWMVKINGNRVETMEIEMLLLCMPELDNAAVKAFTDEDGQTYLAAYYVPVSEISDDVLRKRLSEKLPQYMIPRFFVRMDALPKNTNGKLDRLHLPAPQAALYKTDYLAPETEAEQALCAAFEAVLHCGTVGVNDDFFALGGDSVKVLRLLERIEGLSPDCVLLGRTPKKIAAASERSARIAHLDRIPACSPLLEAQRGVYLECLDAPDSLMYNLPFVCRLPAGTDEARFMQAVRAAILLHPAFSLTFGTPQGVPSMYYTPREISVELVEADELSRAARDFVRPFALEKGPLCRFCLCRTKKELALLFDVHHLIFDGTSVQVLLSQIAAAYDGKPLSPEALTVFDAAASEKNLRESAAYRRAQDFFRETLGDTECDSTVISDRVLPDGGEGAGSVSLRTDGFFRADDAAAFARRRKITENTLFLGAFAYALARFNGMTESCFCTVNSGRHDPRLSDSVGMFVKTLPLYYSIDETAAVSDYLADVQENFFRTMQNDCICFGELAAAYGVNANIVFVYQSELLSGAQTKDGEILVREIENPDTHTDLDVMLLRSGAGYELKLHYKKSLYTEELIRCFAALYLNTVKGMLTAERLSDVPAADAQELRLLERLNSTETPYDTAHTVADGFRAQARRRPDAPCVVCEERKYTYAQVDALSDRLAAYLAAHGVEKEQFVGVLIPRNEYMVIAPLGVLKAGAAYMPLDPAYPPERLRLMLKDSGAKALICDPALLHLVADFDGLRLSTDELASLPASNALPVPPKPEDACVLIYTSGSTGVPKGVVFAHSNLLVTTEFEKRYYAIDENSRAAAYSSFGFDSHLYDLYPALTAGAALYILTEDMRLDLPFLRTYFNENALTHVTMTTQVARQFALLGGLKTLRHLTAGGEKLIPFTPPEGLRFHNAYGPTEGSIITSVFEVDRYYHDIPIGRPVDNLKLYVVGKNDVLLPRGAVGELLLSGPHVTRGYLGRPEKTKEAYGENPFPHPAGYARIYRTGDVVRMLPDGRLQFIGRRDGQVKIRGYRIELTEVEEVLTRFPGVKNAAVAAFDEPGGGGKFLAGYVVSDAPVDIDALAAFVRAEKPPYMVPAVLMQIGSIPLTQNHKVNKKALPVPQRTAGQLTPPENDVQRRIFELTAEILGHKDFGVDTDIYEAGLTSIGAVRLNVALSEAFDAPIRIADVRQNPTVRKLERFFASCAPQKTYEIQDDYPITQNQSGIFVECMAAPGTTVYNIPLLLRLDPSPDLQKLESAIRTAIDAHPYLKTTLFTDAGGNVRAKRNDGAACEVARIRCALLPGQAALVRPFTLLGQPLYRVCIYETDEGNYLFLDLHHILSDGTSVGILLRDVSRAYAGERLTPEAYSGFEAALEEEAVRAGDGYARAKDHWHGLLSGCDAVCMPPRSPEKTPGVGTQYAKMPADGVCAFCQTHGLGLNAFWNAAMAAVLSAFTNREDVVFASVYNGRTDSRLAEAVTMLARTIPVTAAISPDQAAEDFVSSMQRQLLSSMANDACSFAELSHEYGVKADLIFVYQGEEFAFDSLCGKPAALLPFAFDAAKAPISITVSLKDGQFAFTLEHRRELYGTAFAEAMLDALCQAARSLTECGTLGDLDLLSARAEAAYAEANATDAEISPRFAHQLFADCAAKTPDAPAVIAGGELLTFGALNRRANRVANALLRLGLDREGVVGVLLERSVNLPAAELGVLKAGGAFLPMLPDYPDERIDYCLQNAGSPFVLVTETVLASHPDLFTEDKPYKALTLSSLLKEGSDGDPGIGVDPDGLAYCIYTSGSTGRPKGVMISHGNLRNFVQTYGKPLRFFREQTDGTLLAAASICFDMSLFELYLPLCAGRCVCMTAGDELHDPLALRELILKNNVQMMVCTPSFMGSVIGTKQFADAIGNLRSLMLAAEAFPPAVFDTLRKINPELQILNGYGPTETTVGCSYKELQSADRITVGSPAGNVKLFVADRRGSVLPPYGLGELIICGAGVGKGYVGLPDKTAAAFFTLNGLPAYHSGDLVRMNADGEIEFFGRIDDQIKLRGFRVEPDEIEKIICTYPYVTRAKVVMRNNGREDYLAGFFTADTQVDPAALTAHLQASLAYYMVPSVLMQLDEMPMTSNGKIDKKALPETRQTAKKSSGKKAKKSLEQRLCEIFAAVLSLDEVFADDGFFTLGGTSLSASKVTMLLMSEGIEVKYGDIFDHPTPEALAEFIETRDAAASAKPASANEPQETTREALRHNVVRETPKVRRDPLGNVLLTGAVGFLGIHVLRELLALEQGHIYCLVRRGKHRSAEVRLKSMLVYYFSSGFARELEERITVLEADITDEKLADVLKDVPFDTVINCAACVKHFSDNDILEQINVHGVENLISICKARNARLVQISTVSVPGIHTPETYEKQLKMHENELFVVDDMDNKYAISKYHAELKMLDAIEAGLRGKIVRVGNLMGRHSDGEFQANLETNMFMSGIRGFVTMGKYPISHMTDPMRFSPVDCTARAVVLLAGTNDMFTAFNADNRYGFDEMKVIDACNRCGIPIVPTADPEYYAEFKQKLGDPRINARLNGLAAYDVQDAHVVDTDNRFTTNVLYRIGFSWPLVDDAYLDRAIRSIMTLEYFDMDETEEGE